MNHFTIEWAEIEKLREQQLPRSLLPKVDSIYQAALKEKNYEQLIKAIIFQLNCIGILEENEEGANKIFNNLKNDAETIPRPAKSIIYSMIGQMYKDFYDQNRWRISNRTSVNVDLQDVRTYDVRKLIEEALKYYQLSLQDAETLQNEPVENFHAILTSIGSADNQSTLYDLLANRALDFYSSPFYFQTSPQGVFVINNPDYFADVQTFSKLNLSSKDTLSVDYLSLITYQNLLRFHLKKSGFGHTSAENVNKNITALIDIDLRRISYLKEKGIYAGKEKLYENTLIRMSKEYQPFEQNTNVLLHLGGYYFDLGDKWRHDKNDVNKSGYSKAYEICEQIENEYPSQFDRGADDLKNNILEKELNMQTESVQLPGQPFLTKLNFRNLEAVYKTVYTLSEAQAIDYTDNFYRYRNNDTALSKFIRSLKKEISQEQVKLPHVSDYQYYTTEIMMSPLMDGFYLTVLSDTKDWLTSSTVFATSMVQVSPLMAQDRCVDDRLMVIVTDRQTGKHIPDAKITVYQHEKVQTSFKSNKDGIARGKISYYSKYRVNAGNKQLIVFNTAYNRNIYKEDERLAVMFTDRSIYRPGQTVYFKAILYSQDIDKEKKLLQSSSVNVLFRDVNRQTISEKSLKTNEFGSVDGSFSIPQGMLNGDMTLVFEGYGNTSIRVEEYKRPTFEVKFDPIEGNFSFNQQVTVTANAKAFAGYSIDQASVQYRVIRTERSLFFSRWYPPASTNREISSGILQTDENGNVSIEFTTLADDINTEKKVLIYTVTADVTDVNGETRSATMHLNVSDKPLLVQTNLPEHVLAGKKDHFTVETTNLSGNFTPASVTVEISSLKSPGRIFRKQLWGSEIDLTSISKDDFRRYFPLDVYMNETNPELFEVVRKVADYTVETTENKKLDLSSLQHSGYYRLKLTADNQKGVVADHIRYFYYTSDKPEAINNMEHWLTVVKDTGEPGEQVEFLIAGGENESYIYCEVIHQARIIEAKWFKASTKPMKINFPIKEEHRGGFDIQFNMVQNNRLYSFSRQIVVPFTNKMLEVKLATFRDQLLPGEQETWKMLVSHKKGEKETAEIVASLYDASLDAFKPHDWSNIIPQLYRQQFASYTYLWNFAAIHRMAVSSFVSKANRYGLEYFSLGGKIFANINWFDETYKMAFGENTRMMLRSRHAVVESAMPITAMGVAKDSENVAFQKVAEQSDAAGRASEDDVQSGFGTAANELPEVDLTTVATRTNFNETAFFYPKLRTNENGEVLIEFTMPEALTRWKFLSFAHTKDFKVGSYTNELITQKQVAISANVPRFFRENDVIEVTAKVNNLTENDLNGQALLRLYDAATMQPVDDIIQSDKTLSYDVKAGGSAGLRWKLTIPAGTQAITYQLTAQAGTHTDGEEKTVPVLTNSMLVTETLPFSVRAGKEKTFTLDKLINNRSNTLRHHSLTLEYTSAPAWYAVQALPYIMEYPYECSEQTFSRYYANTLATTIVNQSPRIKQIFELWNTQDSKALLSNLEKNQELKQVMLEETPWVLQAKNESERKKRIGLLFDLNRMSNELTRAFNQLNKVQNPDGGFPWFAGKPSNRYITQHIVAGMAHLKKLGAMQAGNAADADRIVSQGLTYLDRCMEEDYNELIRHKSDMEKQQIGSLQLHYLYACSFGSHKPEGKQKVAYDYYLHQAGQYWTNFSVFEKALTALVLHRNNQPDKATAIIRSLKEYAQQSEEMGMYWKDNIAGYFWYQAPIETQALLIEAFNEVTKDTEAVEEMKIWLLRSKQTNDWKTTKATSEAIYALLMTGGNLLDESKLLSIEIAGKPLPEVVKEEIRPEPGTGYVKTSWHGSDITPQMGRLKVFNPNNMGIAWGGMYWQYFEQLDKITSAETNLRMNKQLFLRTLTSKGEELLLIENGEWRMENGQLSLTPERKAQQPIKLKVGDLVRVRMELRADRDYEYVHLKDMRASGFEPVSTLSGHRYQDGLWYYESIKDASTNFFITYLPKGTYVFEYSLRVTHAGDFSNGITTFQCMYAPEFSAHSEGIRVTMVGSE
ncbi:MAG: hypothetical protein LBE79_04485 [Tannerella sp.]|nr:hypothetical protein [Tannerella sp.]